MSSENGGTGFLFVLEALISKPKRQLNSAVAGYATAAQSLTGANRVERLTKEAGIQRSDGIRKINVVEDVRRLKGHTDRILVAHAADLTESAAKAAATSEAATAPASATTAASATEITAAAPAARRRSATGTLR